MVYKSCHLNPELEITELTSVRYMVSLISIEFDFGDEQGQRKLRQNILYGHFT
jgi:hypothetical protein